MELLQAALILPQSWAMPLAVLLALAIDRAFGEPRAALHPVVWMGRYLERVGPWIAPVTSVVSSAALAVGSPDLIRPAAVRPHHSRPFLFGTLAWCVGAAGVVAVAVALCTLLNTVWTGPAAQALCVAILLKPLFAWRMLHDEVRAVEAALQDSLEAGRTRLSWLCSRPVAELDASEVRETAIETLAENLNDSVVAPLFWFALAGLPGAALYRFANTADAMWGYRGERGGRDWTFAGRCAARADDVLSWIPARLTALLLAAAGGPNPGRVEWSDLRREAGLTPSPNSGWPMAAMALSLDIRLGKPGVYRLNAAGHTPQTSDVQQACATAKRAVAGIALIAAAVGLALLAWHGNQA
jgi:adenosylcobinamide-phosphate synthase